ncbi:Nitrogen permease regulator 2 [Hypsizygus marmoreus]|uniref:Nitrogen permease regulator 2 n=1 Tax=Hypsizygus marmoreus TaxID=39966 RepID=A0A369JRS0_HYPMA|nr:Nitrogen permease regulator 2 [Hypsizygus marmoreus]
MNSDSFLPRIQSVFYSVFDIQQGPKIIYQVPEDLIAVSDSPVPPTSPIEHRGDRSARSASTSTPYLFHFDDISKYVIPHPQLCGRLVTCSTRSHRIIGFPVELRGAYTRNYFRYNFCFVFDRSADLSCYEPIVRKVSRVLSSCEKESRFLSNPETSTTIHAILEQLYEDLNSYAETSIPIDHFNSIELKIFPFYPNPPPVNDWMVPLALINITKRMEDNWDLTMVKVCKFIDGTNHVSRIAHLADCDIVLTRQAISHLLFYQVIMTIDIFQYSNMYTLVQSIKWLAEEAHVRDECGPYVTRPGHPIPDWPQLLRLYSRVKPGKTVLEWMDLYKVHQLGIDARRFTSFGVIKGFLRRVHRWPVLLPPDPSQAATLPLDSQAAATGTTFPRKRVNSFTTGTSLRFPTFTHSPPLVESASTYLASQPSALFRGRSPSTAAVQSPSPEVGESTPTLAQDLIHNGPHPVVSPVTVVPISATHRARRASAAEKVLEQLRSRDLQKTGGSTGPIVSSPRMSWIHYQQKDETITIPDATAAINSQDGHYPPRRPESRRQSLITPIGPPPSPVLPKSIALPPNSATLRQRPSWSQPTTQQAIAGGRPYPIELLGLLNGEHHTDELAVAEQATEILVESASFTDDLDEL